MEGGAASGLFAVTVLVSLFQNVIDGTIWTDIDDQRAFQVLDLQDIEKMFSAYQRQQVGLGGLQVAPQGCCVLSSTTNCTSSHMCVCAPN